jgi:hypothetical protein
VSAGWYPANFGRRNCGHYFVDPAGRSLCRKSRRRDSEPMVADAGRRCRHCQGRLAKLLRGPLPGRSELGRFQRRHRATRPNLQQRRHSLRRADGRFVPSGTAPLVFKLPAKASSGKCAHGFTTTERNGDRFACWLCREQETA